VSALREKDWQGEQARKEIFKFPLAAMQMIATVADPSSTGLLRKSRNFCKNRVDQDKRKVRLKFPVESGGSLKGEWCSSSFF
jgi:hypothetical protein